MLALIHTLPGFFSCDFLGAGVSSSGRFFSALRSIGILVVGHGLIAPNSRSAAARIESGEPEKLQMTASAHRGGALAIREVGHDHHGLAGLLQRLDQMLIVAPLFDAGVIVRHHHQVRLFGQFQRLFHVLVAGIERGVVENEVERSAWTSVRRTCADGCKDPCRGTDTE